MVIARILAVLAALLLASCSLTRVAYDNAPPLLAWMADDYFDLSGEQRGWVRGRLERAFVWHRASELPEYRRFLETALGRCADGISVEDARWAWQNVRGYYRRSIEHLLPDMADFVATLDAGQVAALEKRFAEDNTKIEKPYRKSRERERQVKRAERYIDQLEDWTGRLSASQRDFVASQVARMDDLTEERLADRRRRQGELLAILRAREGSRTAAAAGLRRLLLETEKWRDPAYARKLADRDEHVFALVAALDATLSPEQRANVQKRMRGYLRDVGALQAAL